MQHTLSTLRVEKDYYTTTQVAEIYKVTQATVRNWLRKGWLKGEKKFDGKNSRWHVWPQQLEDIQARQDELIELSRRYWMRLYVKQLRAS